MGDRAFIASCNVMMVKVFEYDGHNITGIDILQAYPRVCDGTLNRFTACLQSEHQHDMPPGFRERVHKALKGLVYPILF